MMKHLGVLDFIGIIFVILKLTHVIAWSWWYVLMPFWLALAILVFVAGVLVLVASGRDG